MNNWNNKTTKELIKAVLSLKNEGEVERFLRDLLTPQEIIEFGKRWQAARMLNQNISYIQIVKTTGLSSTTVARVSRWLKRGMGGYRLAIQRLENNIHHHGNSLLAKRSG